MDRRYSTVIFVPSQGGPSRKVRVSHRLLFSVMSVVTSALLLSVFFTVQYYQAILQNEQLRVLRSQTSRGSERLEKELADANAQLGRSMRNVEAATAQLILERRQRERQLADMVREYEQLKALTAGQERIAEAHRAILERRSLSQRLLEQLTAFLVGVLSSLVATFIWYLRKAKPVSAEEAERFELK